MLEFQGTGANEYVKRIQYLLKTRQEVAVVAVVEDRGEDYRANIFGNPTVLIILFSRHQ